MPTCENCGDEVNHLYRSEHPETFKPISVCEDCEWGDVNGLYYKTQSELNSDQRKNKMMRRVKDIECEKCGHEFSTSEHTQCPVCKKKEEEIA